MLRCVIIAAADIGNYEYLKSLIRREDFIVYCDGGLRHMDGIGRKPDLIVGDFDSHADPHMDIETIVLPREKDDTDTVYATKTALNRGYREFLLLGVLGGRMDHGLGNIQLLTMLKKRGAVASIVDDCSEMEIITDGEKAYVEDKYRYFSLISLSDITAGVNITNSKYNLENGTFTNEFPIGISNEVLKGGAACISVEKGTLLLIKIYSEQY